MLLIYTIMILVMVRAKLKSITRFDLFSMHVIPTFIVFLMMMVLIGFSWRTATRAVTDTRNETVDELGSTVQANIKQRLQLYENTLRAASGLFESSDSVSRDEWRRFVASLDIKESLPASLVLGYAEIIPASQLNAYEARIRAEGFPTFNVTPEEPARDIYSSVTYFEPDNDRNRQAFGGDMLVNAPRREAMERARDSGKTSMSDVASTLQEDGSRENGITIYQPVYRPKAPIDTVEQRRAALTGYIYTALRSSDLFGNVFESNTEDFNFEIYDGEELKPETLLYNNHPSNGGFSHIYTDKITLSDQQWDIRFSAKDTIVPESVRRRPGNVATGGTIFAAIVALVVYLLLQRRTRILAFKEERKIERAKDNLLSLASHQLRTPATGVKQYIGMVLEGFVGKISKEQQDLLARAYESNERQLRIINEFLYLAKADADRVVISPQKFDLAELARQIVSDMESEVNEAGHTIKIVQKNKKLEAVADTHSVRMIIENLLSNAIKYTPAGGRIIVTLKRDGGNAVLEVKDNGVGIEKKDYPKLFRQFSRIPNKLTRQTSGSGIGLYLADYLAKLNGGTITVESEAGKGSTFRVRFRRKNVKKFTDINIKKKVR